MSSQRSQTVTNSLGYAVPRPIAELPRDSARQPWAGRLIDRFNAHVRYRRQQAKEAQRTRQIEANEQLPPPPQFSFVSCTPDGSPKFAGSILRPSSDDGSTNSVPVNCNGYITSMLPGNAQEALVVLEMRGGERIPCLCPTAAFDQYTIEAGRIFATEQSKKRRLHSCENAAYDESIDAIPAKLGEVQGHLLLGGAQGLRGRVVDTTMLASLNGGCLRMIANPGMEKESQKGKRFSAFLTLSHQFVLHQSCLKSSAQQIVVSTQGMALFNIGPLQWPLLVELARLAIDSKLQWHRTMISAIDSLNMAGATPSTTIDDELLMVSIGGDLHSMTVGRFLPCGGKISCPDIRVRCACGFVVDKSMKRRARNLMTPCCKHIKKNR